MNFKKNANENQRSWPPCARFGYVAPSHHKQQESGLMWYVFLSNRLLSSPWHHPHELLLSIPFQWNILLMTLTLPNTIASNQSLFQWHQKCRQYMLSINDQFDTSHRIDHIDRVLQNALEIQDQHPSDINIILPAVMLHDCIPIDKRSPKRSQASTL